ncbi:MAG: hypothetical protein M0R32_09600 [Candidatus Cloacimonetes bacterium]|jgi:hypothetical protein|nr:hypothetical protein [Candidatus Cloacimonadota bacterium]
MSENSVFGKPLKKKGFKGKWNPEKPCDIHNPLPQKEWPNAWNEPVFFIIGYDIFAGRVSWYHPARAVDKDCLITPGNPVFNIEMVDEGGYISSTRAVYPGTKEGFDEARMQVIEMLIEAIQKEKKASKLRIDVRKEEVAEMAKMEMPV